MSSLDTSEPSALQKTLNKFARDYKVSYRPSRPSRPSQPFEAVEAASSLRIRIVRHHRQPHRHRHRRRHRHRHHQVPGGVKGVIGAAAATPFFLYVLHH